MKFGSDLITVTSRSGLIFRDNIAAGPPAPPQPMITNLLLALMLAPYKIKIGSPLNNKFIKIGFSFPVNLKFFNPERTTAVI